MGYCKWTVKDYGYVTGFSTGCGHLVENNSGVASNYSFCPYCGKNIGVPQIASNEFLIGFLIDWSYAMTGDSNRTSTESQALDRAIECLKKNEEAIKRCEEYEKESYCLSNVVISENIASLMRNIKAILE